LQIRIAFSSIILKQECYLYQMLQDLLDIGFQEIGSWQWTNNKISLDLFKLQNVSPALYAFAHAGDVKYVGKTSQTLKKRLYFYGKPGSRQKTNLRLNAILIELLKNEQVIKIYGFSDSSSRMVGNFKINLPAAIEDDIIQKLQPEWNKRK